MPGYRVRVVDVTPDGTMTLDVDGVKSSLGPELADNMWVRRAAARRARTRR
jgi:hypothetical protein